MPHVEDSDDSFSESSLPKKARMSDSEDSRSPSPAPAAPTQPLLDEGDICGDGSILKEIITRGSGRKPTKVRARPNRNTCWLVLSCSA
jgi:hypothetical protein